MTIQKVFNKYLQNVFLFLSLNIFFYCHIELKKHHKKKNDTSDTVIVTNYH